MEKLYWKTLWRKEEAQEGDLIMNKERVAYWKKQLKKSDTPEYRRLCKKQIKLWGERKNLKKVDTPEYRRLCKKLIKLWGERKNLKKVI